MIRRIIRWSLLRLLLPSVGNEFHRQPRSAISQVCTIVSRHFLDSYQLCSGISRCLSRIGTTVLKSVRQRRASGRVRLASVQYAHARTDARGSPCTRRSWYVRRAAPGWSSSSSSSPHSVRGSQVCVWTYAREYAGEHEPRRLTAKSTRRCIRVCTGRVFQRVCTLTRGQNGRGRCRTAASRSVMYSTHLYASAWTSACAAAAAHRLIRAERICCCWCFFAALFAHSRSLVRLALLDTFAAATAFLMLCLLRGWLYIYLWACGLIYRQCFNFAKANNFVRFNTRINFNWYCL